MKIRRLTLKPMFPGRPVKFQYTAVNYGESDAVITEHNQTIVYQHADLISGPLINKLTTRRTVNIPIIAGAFADIVFEEPVMQDDQMNEITQGTQPVAVYGYVAYKDDLGTLRRSGFFRAYSAKTRRFTPVDDPEYEYQD